MGSDYIKRIAKLITDDPDLFNETTTTGGIAMPAMPINSSRKKKRRAGKAAQYDVDLITGLPKGPGQILCSDKQIQEAKSKKSKSKPELLSPKPRINDLEAIRIIETTKKPPPIGLEHGQIAVPPDINKPENAKLFQYKVYGDYQTGTKSSIADVNNLAVLFQNLSGGHCNLYRSFNKYARLIKRYIESGGESSDLSKFSKIMPPKGWWGQDWTRAGDRWEYLNKTFFGEVCALYLKEIRQRFLAHKEDCNDPKCKPNDHLAELQKLICLTHKDEKGYLQAINSYALEDAWSTHFDDRFKAIARFKQRATMGRNKKERIVLGTPEDRKRYEAWLKLPSDEQALYSFRDIFSDTGKQMMNFYKDHPKFADSGILGDQDDQEVISSYKKGDEVVHAEHGPGYVHRDSPNTQGDVYVVFDKDLEASGMIYPRPVDKRELKTVSLL